MLTHYPLLPASLGSADEVDRGGAAEERRLIAGAFCVVIVGFLRHTLSVFEGLEAGA